MTPELAHALAAMRLRQTAELLAWMADNFTEPGLLARATEHVTEALGIVEQHRL